MCIEKNETIEYYDKNAKEYFDKSVSVDMNELYSRFLEYVPIGGSILDIGCGSGRDLKYFKDQGYHVEGLEPSVELNRLASVHSGCLIHLDTVQHFIPAKQYDAIWACASLLHLTTNELVSFFSRIGIYVKSGGIIFISMKSGIESGKDELGRYFENFDDETLQSILGANAGLSIISMWDSDDNINRNDFRWRNVILKWH